MAPDDFAQLFDLLWDNCEHFISDSEARAKARESRLEVWWEVFKSYPAEVFRRGVVAYLSSDNERGFPKPAAVKQAIHDTCRTRSDKPPKMSKEEVEELRGNFEEFVKEAGGLLDAVVAKRFGDG